MFAPPRSAAAVIALLLAAALAVGAARSLPPAAPTALKVFYWPHGQQQPGKQVWTLSCQPAAGTHPKAKQACAELAAHPGALEAVTKPCTLLLPLGTPATLVSGRHHGSLVNRLFRPRCDPLWAPLHALLTGV